MKLANNAMLGCMFVTYIDKCKHIMFTVQSDHHGTSIRFQFHVRLKPLCKGTLINILTDHNVRYTREEFVNCSVKPNIAITDIKTITKLVPIIIPTGTKEKLVSVPVASTQFTEIHAGTKVALTDFLTDNKVPGTEEELIDTSVNINAAIADT